MNKKLYTAAMFAACAGVNFGGMLEDAARKASNGHTKYEPHQGSKEQQRRLRQMARTSK